MARNRLRSSSAAASGGKAAAARALFRGTERLATLGDWLRWAVSAFNRAGLVFAQGTPRAGDEALALLQHALDFDEDVPPFLGARLTPREIAAVREVLRRRIVERVPTAYLTGEARLGGHRFVVDEGVLIPRSYFVELIPEGLRAARGGRRPVRRALDVCTGSGCLAILLAHAWPDATVDATEISPDALAVAAQNVALHGLGDRVQLLEGDLFEPCGPARYDLIVANPPYEPTALCDDLPPELRHEPRLALDGGADGLTLVRRIVAEAPRYLAAGGLLAVEVGGLRAELEAAFPAVPWKWPKLADGSAAVAVARGQDLRRLGRSAQDRQA